MTVPRRLLLSIRKAECGSAGQVLKALATLKLQSLAGGVFSVLMALGYSLLLTHIFRGRGWASTGIGILLALPAYAVALQTCREAWAKMRVRD